MFFVFLAMFFFFAGNSNAQETGVVYPTEFKITKPLRDLVKEHPFVEPDFNAPVWVSPDRKNRPHQTFIYSSADGPEYGNDPSIIQTAMGIRQIPQSKAVLQNWAGVTSSSYPPDPTGAVGPNHYVQMVNATTVRIFSKTGSTILSFQLGTLWGLGSNAGDPIVMYDKFADRWFLSQFGSSSDRKIYIAVSQTNDPTGSYYTWTYVSPQFPDYLKFSIWQDGYYMTSNQTTDKVYVFERSVMLTGGAGARGIYSTFTTGSVSSFFIPLPADAADNTSLPAAGTAFPFFAYYDNAWGTGVDGIKIWNMTTNWTTGTASISSPTQVNTSSFDASYDASWDDCPQPNGVYLDGIGGVLMYRVPWRSWTGYNNVVLSWGVLIADSPRQRAIYWCELRQISGTWTMYQQGIYNPDASTRWMSSAAMDDNGSIALCYAKSSTSIYPGLYYTGRLASDPLGTMSFAETQAIAGSGSQSTYNRFGDYAQTSLDPDGITFWHTGEYVGSGSGQETRIYSFQLPLPVLVASVAVAVTSGVNPTCTGSSVTFTATPTNGGTAPTYQWQKNGSNISGATNNTYTSATLVNGDVITCVMTSNLGGVTGNPATSNAISMTVNAIPATPAASSNTPVCAGSAINLTTPTVTGATYSWTGPNSFTSATQNPTIASAAAANAGAYSVTTTVSGCTSLAGSTTVVINSGPATPSASSNSPLCLGAAINLTTPAVTGATYSWTGPNSFTSALRTPTISSAVAANAGTYSVTITQGGCASLAGTTTVVLNAPPVAAFAGAPTSTTCSGFVQFTDNSTGGPVSWLWDFGDGQTSTMQSPSHTYTAGGTYAVTLTATNGCGNNQIIRADYVTIDISAMPAGVSASSCGPGSMTLSASAAGTLNWYDAATGGNLLTTGTTYVTPNLSSSTSYYVESVVAGATAYTGLTNIILANTSNISAEQGMIFTALQPFVLKSVKVRSVAAAAASKTVTLKNSSNATLSTVTVNNVPTGESRITLNISVPVGTNLKLTAPANSYLMRDNTVPAGTYPITLPDVLSITTTTASSLPENYYYFFYDWEVVLPSCTSERTEVTASVYTAPLAEAGNKAIYSGASVQIGSASNGPGIISWLPATGLDNAAAAQPLASPATTTTYTVTVDNNGCIATDTVTIIYGNTGHTISGKTRYAAKANSGAYGFLPTFNSVIYNIGQVIVILKNSPAGTEVARDTSDAQGNYQFNSINDGNYILSYDKYTADTMQWGDGVNAIDVSLMMYYITSDSLYDPSRWFAATYKKAANVDNNASVNSIDVSRIKSKIGSPALPSKNFPKGNWVALNKAITVAGSDITVNLETICYGDYNASSSKYKDSITTWSAGKSLPENIIHQSDESITTSNRGYFEVPLRISTKINEFAALSLELSYPNNKYKLVSVSMPKTSNKNGTFKINPTLEEVIAADNDLLVTDADGIIRVVFATTDHFDVAPNDEMISLGFRPVNTLKQGAVEFKLSGTGVIGNQFGEENEDAYLMMPRIFVQGNNTDAGFDFTGYPNPFSGDATLTYSIPENGSVKLNVYNALGELVTELVNEKQESGKHSVVFSQKNLPEGMYTFKLEFTGLNKSKNLILKLVH